MPICEGCGSSFDNTFEFCPQCGRYNTSLDNETKEQTSRSCKKCLVPFDNSYKGNFCPKCGTNQITTCLNCGHGNWWSNKFCEKCGEKIVDYKYAISKERCRKWFDYFWFAYPHYRDLYWEGKIRKTKEIKNLQKVVMNEVNPNPDKSHLAYQVQITNELFYTTPPWNFDKLLTKLFCIDLVQINEKEISTGLFFVFSDHIGIVDCTNGKGIFIDHKDFIGYSRDNLDNITLSYSNQLTMKLHFHLPSKARSNFYEILTFAGAIAATAMEPDDVISRSTAEINNSLNSIKQKLESLNNPQQITFSSIYNEGQAYMTSIEALLKEIFLDK